MNSAPAVAAMRELFIYYRVRPGMESAALNVVQTMQQRLRQAFPHLQARVLRRPNADGSAQTWMETYATSAEAAEGVGVGSELERTIERHAAALVPCIEGGRHVEAFVPLPNEPETR